jgi:streptomycin 6-kinase
MAELLTASARRALLRNRNDPAGRAWVERLPEHVGAIAERWSLVLEPHFENLSFNYVAPVRRPDGSLAVLKLALPSDPETRSEIAALRHFAGRGASQLLASDVARGALLIERLLPGAPVSRLGDDAAEVRASAAVMRQLFAPSPPDHGLPTIERWIETARGAVAPWSLRHGWIAAGLELAGDLVRAPASDAVVLHGDLHHDNLLSCAEGFRAIDPKGVIGEAAWEVGPYLYNHLPDDAGESRWRRCIARRADQFAEELALDRQRVRACAAGYAALSTAWDAAEPDAAWLAKHRAVVRELAGI